MSKVPEIKKADEAIAAIENMRADLEQFIIDTDKYRELYPKALTQISTLNNRLNNLRGLLYLHGLSDEDIERELKIHEPNKQS
jgi:DNA repair exonuclease SbcCD ATPase subunit